MDFTSQINSSDFYGFGDGFSDDDCNFVIIDDDVADREKKWKDEKYRARYYGLSLDELRRLEQRVL